MFLKVDTPYRLVLQFLLFKSESVDHAVALLEKYRLRYALGVGEIQQGIDHMHQSMPATLRDWHTLGGARTGLPPRQEATQWFLDHEMFAFYRHLVDRPANDVDLNHDFQKAWEFFENCRLQRFTIEALRMAEIPPHKVYKVCEESDAPLNLPAMEIYFSQIFNLDGLFDSDMEAYLKRLEDAAKSNISLGSEARGKRAGFNNPMNPFVVMTACGHTIKLSKDMTVEYIKAAAMSRLISASRSDVSDADLDRLQASNPVFAGAAHIVTELLKFEQTQDMSGGNAINDKIDLFLIDSRAQRKSRAQLMSAGQLSARGLPAKVSGDDNSN